MQPLRRNGSTSTGMIQHQLLDVVERANDDRHIQSALLFDRSSERCRNGRLVDTGPRPAEHDVAALDVGSHIGEPGRGEGRPQVGHGKSVASTHIDAAQQRHVSVSGHGTLRITWVRAVPALDVPNGR